MNIAIYIYDQAEVLDFSGPFEVFSTASRICPDDNPFAVFLIGETGQAVTARAGYQVVPANGFHDHPPIGVMVIPGGMHGEEIIKPHVIEWISQQGQKAKLNAFVCTRTLTSRAKRNAAKPARYSNCFWKGAFPPAF